MEVTQPRVYLDMDGLLANLFDTLAHRFYGDRDYKELSLEEKKKMKFIWSDKEAFDKHFGSVKELFANLEPFGPGGELSNAVVETVVEMFGEYRILSHPTDIDREGCIEGKKQWIRTYLNQQPVEMNFPQNKSTFAVSDLGKSNILVDDYLPYIKGWLSAGGYPIQMRTDSFNNTGAVKKFLAGELEKAKQSLATESRFDRSINFYLL